MEADSTTYDISKKNVKTDIPFHTDPSNLKVYFDLTNIISEKSLEIQIVERLQNFGLLPKLLKCPTGKPDCRLSCKPARVIDRVQWSCEGCGKRLPIRSGSFFLRLQCSLLQALQMILAWCEDADCTAAAEHFGVKPRVATMIFDKLDELAVREQSKLLLGGDNSVVLAEMYPDCLNRLSPDTTDQPHVHRMLMLADTNHIPTAYKIHVLRDDLKKQSSSSLNNENVSAEVEAVIGRTARAGSLVVASAHAPRLPGAAALQQLARHTDADMQHFLNTRIWRGAVSLCSASRELCGARDALCAGAVQRYLDAALFRRRHPAAFYHTMLALVARHHTEQPTDQPADQPTDLLIDQGDNTLDDA